MTPLLLDGVDVARSLGVGIESQGWNDLISWPSLKEYAVNDWHEADGIQPDLSAPVLNAKEAAVSFYAPDREGLQAFINHWASAPACHTLKSPSLEREFRLRLTKQSNISVEKNGVCKTTLKLAQDAPPTLYQAPVATMDAVNDYCIDQRPFTDYGCRILKGTLAEMTRLPDVKVNLTRDSKYSPGAVYDPAPVTLKSKEAKLYCYMTAPRLSVLWRNYYAMLYWLTRPGERLLYVRDLNGESIPCVYKSARVTEFYPCHKIWLVFDITLTFIRALRVLDDDRLLASESEDDILIFTEDEEFAINMWPNI